MPSPPEAKLARRRRPRARPSYGTSTRGACYIAGVVAFILGLTIVGKNVDLLARLGPSLAVDCVTPILAILFAMVARILKARVEKNARA